MKSKRFKRFVASFLAGILFFSSANLPVFAAEIKQALIIEKCENIQEFTDYLKNTSENTLIISSEKPPDTDNVSLAYSYQNLYVFCYDSKELTDKYYQKFINDGYIVEYNSTLVSDDTENIEIEEIPFHPDNVYDNGFNSFREILNEKESLPDVTVAILDSGLTLSEEEQENYRERIIDTEDDVTDQTGHGSEIAKIILYETTNNVKILPMKVLDGNNQGSVLNFVAGIEKAIEENVSVINISASVKGSSNLLESEIIKAKNAGITVVVSAGNDSADVMEYTPANIGTAVTVSAIDDSLNPSEYSNHGNTVDVSALGYNLDGTQEGTSFSAAYVSAEAALIASYGDIADMDECLRTNVTGTDEWSEYLGCGWIYLKEDTVKDFLITEEDRQIAEEFDRNQAENENQGNQEEDDDLVLEADASISDPYGFYCAYGNTIVSLDDGIYFGTRGKKSSTMKATYNTVAWRFTVSTGAGAIAFDCGLERFENFVSERKENGVVYVYSLYFMPKETFLGCIQSTNGVVFQSLSRSGGTVTADAGLMYREKGVDKSGPYYSREGIEAQAKWPVSVKNGFDNYYNKRIDWQAWALKQYIHYYYQNASGGWDDGGEREISLLPGDSYNAEFSETDEYRYTYVSISAANGNDYTYYMYIPRKTYQVAFYGNGATSGSMSNQPFFFRQWKNLTASTYKKQIGVTYNANGGYCAQTNAQVVLPIQGWALTPTGNIAYGNGQSVCDLTNQDNGTVNLYAKWGDGTVKLPPAIRRGYDFSGWYTANGTRVGGAGDSYTFSSNTVLYARWNPIVSGITYHGNGAVSQNGNSTFKKDAQNALNKYKYEKNIFGKYNEKLSYSIAGESNEITYVNPKETWLYTIKNGKNYNKYSSFQGWSVDSAATITESSPIIAKEEEEYTYIDVLETFNAYKNIKEEKRDKRTNAILEKARTYSATRDYNTYLESTKNRNVILYAIWDNYPTIEATDRYFTLNQANIPDTLALNDTIITEKVLMETVSGYDTECGALINAIHDENGNLIRIDNGEPIENNYVTVYDYDAYNFSTLTGNAILSITYEACDDVGNKTRVRKNVYITSTEAMEKLDYNYTRFISSEYVNKTQLDGGLNEKSIWNTNEAYHSELISTLSDLDTIANQDSSFDATPYIEQRWTFTNEQRKEVVDYIHTHGLSNAKESDALSNFVKEFGVSKGCRTYHSERE